MFKYLLLRMHAFSFPYTLFCIQTCFSLSFQLAILKQYISHTHLSPPNTAITGFCLYLQGPTKLINPMDSVQFILYEPNLLKLSSMRETKCPYLNLGSTIYHLISLGQLHSSSITPFPYLKIGVTIVSVS